ncbi:MAG: hypothetical protein ABR905_19840 [Terracidiphilus sp.]|jgi:hypothetical protein
MRAQSVGRALGIGLRVAVKIAGQRMAVSGQAAEARAAAAVPAAEKLDGARSSRKAVGRTAGKTAGGVVRGIGGFLRPFGRVGGIIWLEVTGVFFFLPVVIFAPTLWRVRASWAHGPDHRLFLVTAGVMLVFLYLGVSSFWRARKR